LKREEPSTIRCPFCGAPHRETIPYGAVQLRCEYCGAIFVPNILSQAIYRCANHPDVIAVGKCNDCGRNFCEQCLNVYDIYDTAFRSELAKLYLCPDCLKRRYVNRADAAMLGGVLLLLVGVLTLAVFASVAPFGSVVFLGFPAALGAVFLLYGLWQKTNIPQDKTIRELRVQDERRREGMLTTDNDLEADDAYNKLIALYANKWGALEGLEFLESELAAHVRNGDTFPEAVKKVYFRQMSRSRSKKS
jgi:hypothetical protein